MIEQDSPIEDDVQPTMNLSIGQQVVVNYDGKKFPGEVTSIDDSDIEVSVMHRSANAWKWPRPEDKIFYLKSEILHVIKPPSVAGNRGQFVFEDIQQLQLQPDVFGIHIHSFIIIIHIYFIHDSIYLHVTLSLQSLAQ